MSVSGESIRILSLVDCLQCNHRWVSVPLCYMSVMGLAEVIHLVYVVVLIGSSKQPANIKLFQA